MVVLGIWRGGLTRMPFDGEGEAENRRKEGIGGRRGIIVLKVL